MFLLSENEAVPAAEPHAPASGIAAPHFHDRVEESVSRKKDEMGGTRWDTTCGHRRRSGDPERCKCRGAEMKCDSCRLRCGGAGMKCDSCWLRCRGAEMKCDACGLRCGGAGMK